MAENSMIEMARRIAMEDRAGKDIARAARYNPQESQGQWNAIALRDLWAQQGEDLAGVIQEQIQTLEQNLKASEELIVYCDAGRDRIRAQSFAFPRWHLAIVCGLDDDGNPTQRIANTQNIELTCKVVKTEPGKTQPKIGFILPVATEE
jgi:hypothetical protein